MPISPLKLTDGMAGIPWTFNRNQVDQDFVIKGVLAQDASGDLFFVDASTGRVGVGTSSPQALLHVDGATKTTSATVDNGLTVTAGGATVTAGGLTVTAGGATITAGGLLVTAGRIREVLTPTDVDTQNNTLTVAQIAGGLVVHTSTTGGGTVTTDTAANIIAGSSGVGALTADGQCIRCTYINDGDQTLTFAGGDSVTVADTGQTLATNESADLLFRRTSSTAVTMYIIGG